MGERIAYTSLETRLGPLNVACSHKGVLRIGLGIPAALFISEMKRGGYNLVASAGGTVGEARRQLSEYLSGDRREFNLPLDLRGTEFQVGVWEAVAGIPFGELRSYRDVAVEAGYPRAWRAVGNAVSMNPVPLIVPCHRVVRSDGGLGGYGGREDLKKELLKLENTLYKVRV